jgi:hypothetical protein
VLVPVSKPTLPSGSAYPSQVIMSRCQQVECEVDKQRERVTVEAFLRFQRYPISSLKEWDRERPDALVQIDERRVGIEVTKVVEATQRQAAPPQQWTTEAHRIVRAAQESFERRHSVALVVSVEIRAEWQPKKGDAIPLGEEIATIIETKTPREAFAGVPFEPVQLKDPHPAASWVYIGYTKQSLGGLWAPSFSGKIQCATAEDILRTVYRKEAEVEVYRRAAPNVWLLIDCNLTGQGILLDVPNLSRGFTLTTGFDRVFCCGFGMWEWVEISCSDAPSAVRQAAG